MNLYEEVEKIKASGYSEQNAQSKLGQDIVLKAIADSGMARNATIKGGVVMRSISGNARRATQDLDLDFIKYSIPRCSQLLNIHASNRSFQYSVRCFSLDQGG